MSEQDAREHKSNCQREIMRHADDSAAYLSERCTCEPMITPPALSARIAVLKAREETECAKMLIELVFLLPRGTNAEEHPAGRQLVRYVEAVRESALVQGVQPIPQEDLPAPAATALRENLWSLIDGHGVQTGRLDQVTEDQAFLRESARQSFRELEARIDALERRQEAASRQPERVERDNVEGGQGITPLPSTASTPETRSEP